MAMKQKMKKGKGKRKGNWNQVPIGEDFLGEKEMENLISLEVLEDYDLVRQENGITEIVRHGAASTSKKAGTKRKIEEDEESDSDDKEFDLEPDEDEVIPDEEFLPVLEMAGIMEDKKPLSKKAQKLENKKNKKLKKSESDDTELISAPIPTPIIETSKKEKKKKQKLKKVAEKKNDVTINSSNEQDTAGQEVSMQEWMKAGVREPVLKALKEAGFHQPTSIQALTLPSSVLGKKDIVGAAETGSGKTLAFAIPMIHGILNARESQSNGDDEFLQALILTPTRELAVQIKKHFDVAARYAGIRSVVIVGGLATQKQERLLRAKPHVVIATPGRLWELVKEGDPHLSNLDKVKYLAVDETDRMVERGHFQELEGILGTLNQNEEHKSQRQNFVFSATLAFTHDPPKRLNIKKNKQQPKKVSAKDKLKQIMEMIGVRANPKIVDITSTKGTCETLQEMQINCPANKKDYYMYYFLIKHPGRTIVFCNSINTVRRLTNLFFLLKCGQVLPLHSEMHQKMRLKNLEKFAENEKSVLIATDVAARGLDIVDIQHVVHYEIPKTAESYIHRSGRTARAFKGGIAIVLVEPTEIGKLKNIFRSLNRDPDKMLPLFNIDGTVFRQLKARVDEADKVEKFEHTVRKKLADMNWMDKAKKEMEIAVSEDDSDLDDESGDGETRHRKNLLQAKKKLDCYKRTLNKLLADNSFMTRLGLEIPETE